MKAEKWIALALVAALYACGGSSGESHEMGSSKAGIDISPDQLGEKIDPICKMDMTKTKIADTLTYNGTLYAFCNSGCKEEFQANPEKYLE